MPELGIDIRAGLHTGEVELAGDDIGGLAVHIAARVIDAEPGSGVMVSSTVKDLVVGSGIEFEERGTHELKGVPGDWQLYSVAGMP
jgi:class 3 adenylate cyclase